MFILTADAIKAIRETPDIKPKICLSLQISERTLLRIIADNEPNNDLTKAAAIKVLREETGYPEGKILKEYSMGGTSKIAS